MRREGERVQVVLKIRHGEETCNSYPGTMIYSVNGKLMTTVCFDDTAAVLLDNIFIVIQ